MYWPHSVDPWTLESCPFLPGAPGGPGGPGRPGRPPVYEPSGHTHISSLMEFATHVYSLLSFYLHNFSRLNNKSFQTRATIERQIINLYFLNCLFIV